MDDPTLQSSAVSAAPEVVTVIAAAPDGPAAPPTVGEGAGGEARVKPGRNYARFMRPAAWLLLAVACVGILLWARAFGTRVVQSRPVNARIEITNPPAWLDRRIVQALLDESYQFAGRDTETYNRTRDILDAGVLKEFANLYTGTDTVDGKRTSRQANGYNAWISKITQVRRNVAADNGMQSIQITAQWRQPVAWIRSDASGSAHYYLIDAQGTRLPGEYTLSELRGTPLMTLAGVDLPAAGLPAPGEKWFAKATGAAAIGDDLAAGLKLMELLQGQKFARQIAAINMANYGGRVDGRGAWINLETVWAASGDVPRVVAWGRPIGEEKYYEVQAGTKLRTLKEIYAKYGRIDADRTFLDIRTEFVRTPKLASQSDAGAGHAGSL